MDHVAYIQFTLGTFCENTGTPPSHHDATWKSGPRLCSTSLCFLGVHLKWDGASQAINGRLRRGVVKGRTQGQITGPYRAQRVTAVCWRIRKHGFAGCPWQPLASVNQEPQINYLLRTVYSHRCPSFTHTHTRSDAPNGRDPGLFLSMRIIEFLKPFQWSSLFIYLFILKGITCLWPRFTIKTHDKQESAHEDPPFARLHLWWQPRCHVLNVTQSAI